MSWLAGHGTVDEIPALSEAGSRASRQAIAAIQARIGGELALVAAPGDLSLTEPARARPTERASP